MTLSSSLAKYLSANGLTQGEAAERLDTSQSTISKIIKEHHSPRPALRRRIEALASEETRADWMDRVERTARTNPAFRELLQAAMELANENE